MPLQPLTDAVEGVEDTDDVETVGLRNDMELWANEEILRVGFDVLSGDCAQLTLGAVEDFADFVESEPTDTASFEAGEWDTEYLFETDYHTVYVYHNREHIATFDDYEKFPIDDVRVEAREQRIKWDVGTVARSAIESVAGPTDTVRVERVDQHLARVHVTASHFSFRKAFGLATADGVDCYSPRGSVSFDDEQDHERFVLNSLDSVDVAVLDDGSVEYRVRVDTQKLVAYPEADG